MSVGYHINIRYGAHRGLFPRWAITKQSVKKEYKMIKFYCKQCEEQKSYATHREAYMDGWFIEGMELKGFIIPKGVQLCHKCGINQKPIEPQR